MSPARTTLLFMASALVALPALADRRIAVLPVLPTDTDASPAELDRIEQALRKVTHDTLEADGYTLLEGEAVHLAMSKCVDSCVDHWAEMATQLVDADFIVSAQVERLGDRFQGAVRLLDREANVLSIARTDSVRLENLGPQFAAKAVPFFAGALHEKPLPPPEPPKIPGLTTTNAWEITFEPLAGHGTWTLLDAKDHPLCELPCTHWVPPGSGYTVKPSDDSPLVHVQHDLNLPWGAAMQAVMQQRAGNVMLHPAWLGLAAPLGVLGGLGTLGWTGVLIVMVANNSIQSFVWPVEVGVIVVTVASIWWWVEIIRDRRHDGLILSPLDPIRPASAMHWGPAAAWAQVMPAARPER